jgi:hypothetical protein
MRAISGHFQAMAELFEEEAQRLEEDFDVE